MKLNILISTIGNGINQIPKMLLPERDDVQYIISWQTGKPERCDTDMLSLILPHQQYFSQRKDVKLFIINGRGLSKNRNNAIFHAEGDICIIADDDCHYTNEYFDSVIKIYEQNQNIDIALCKATTKDGIPHKVYPRTIQSYSQAMQNGYSPSSVEMTFRRNRIETLKFNELFGLGCDYLCCGEEEVFLHDAMKKGLDIRFFPYVIVETSNVTTGTRFLTDKIVQRSKGAVFRYCFGRFGGLWHCVKEALHYLIFKRINPTSIFKNMLDGYNYCNSNI